MNKANHLGKLTAYLNRMDRVNLAYRLECCRDAIMVIVDIPGERWEVEFFDDGHVEIEKFKSDGEIFDDEMLLENLIQEYEEEIRLNAEKEL